MDEWLAQVASPGASNFDEMMESVAELPWPQGSGDPSVVAEMSLRDALVLFSKRVLVDPVLKAAAIRIYDDNWLVRQMSATLYGLI